jgi:exosortase
MPTNTAKQPSPKNASRRHAQPAAPAKRSSGHATLSVGALALGGLGLWAFWPVIARLAAVWETDPDYGHGYLVPLVAVGLAWWRRERRPPGLQVDRRGLAVVACAMGLLIVGGRFYLPFVQDLALLLWLFGVSLTLGGRAALGWLAPSLGFLVFMVPVPYRLEQLVTLPLQQVATSWSCWLLECLGQPAVAEGNVVLVNEVRLEVAEACSGLRLFVCVVALAYLHAVVSRRAWWTKLAAFALIVPVAMLANTLRITATGLAWQQLAEAHSRELAHEVAGWLMLPLAAVLIELAMWYVARLVVPVEAVDVTRLMWRPGAEGVRPNVAASRGAASPGAVV